MQQKLLAKKILGKKRSSTNHCARNHSGNLTKQRSEKTICYSRVAWRKCTPKRKAQRLLAQKKTIYKNSQLKGHKLDENLYFKAFYNLFQMQLQLEGNIFTV